MSAHQSRVRHRRGQSSITDTTNSRLEQVVRPVVKRATVKRYAWHRQGTHKTGSTYNQPKRPSTGTTHRPSTRHYRKGSPGVKPHKLQASSVHVSPFATAHRSNCTASIIRKYTPSIIRKYTPFRILYQYAGCARLSSSNGVGEAEQHSYRLGPEYLGKRAGAAVGAYLVCDQRQSGEI